MEDILSNEERNAILRQVLTPSVSKEASPAPKQSSTISEKKADLSQLSFGELLENTLVQRQEMDKEDSEGVKKIDEAREKAISGSRFDILKDWKL